MSLNPTALMFTAPIEPGETYKYEFQLRQHGTFMYHSHSDEMTQIALGMMGMFVIRPRNPTGPKADRDFALMMSEWRIDVGTMRQTDFNVLTFNGRVFQGTAPLVSGKIRRPGKNPVRELKRYGSSSDPSSWVPLESHWNGRWINSKISTVAGDNGPGRRPRSRNPWIT